MGACEYEARLHAYRDGELSPEEQARMEAHLLQCASCALESRRLERLSELMALVGRPGVPDDLYGRLDRQLERMQERTFAGTIGWLTAAAAAVLVTCACWLWGLGTGSEGPARSVGLWETAAVTFRMEEPLEAREQAFTDWLVTDLTQEPGHE